MTIQIGKRSPEPDLVTALEECHVRIRRFLELARRMVDLAAPIAELPAAAHDVARYFREALPQHVADEHLLAERLAGRDSTLDSTLETMRVEHAIHEAPVALLVNACVMVERTPSSIERIRIWLGAVIDEIERLIVPHLELEERVLFPAIRALDPAERRALYAEIRTRRERALAIMR